MRFLLLALCALGASASMVGNWSDYYKNIDPDSSTLKADLTSLIFPHTQISYDDVWTAFTKMDESYSPCKTGEIIDPYSAKCWVYGEKCGNYKKEGDCFNREHGWPKSWWGGFSQGKGAQTDMHHLFPVDGYVNAMRSNYPLGDVDPGNIRYTSTNGALLGGCSSSQAPSDQKCFEMPDEWKGDFARAYFYIATAYDGTFDCCDEAGVDAAHLKPWEEDTLRTWHNLDPVSDEERTRNDDIYTMFQKNRNPFVDYPSWVEKINEF